MKTFTVPNMLTFLRILGMPVFILAFITGHITAATVIFIIAILTDIFDGAIARMNKSRTVLGSILDPLADKLLVDIAFLLLAGKGLMPYWLVTIIISKDVILVLGWLIVYIVTVNIKVEPSVFGKFANFFESFLVIILMITLAYPSKSETLDFLPFLISGTMYATAAIAGFALIDYVLKGIKRLG
ncbi:MAG: CDP-alcohol phosphatidyltransferase family protein [Candidatus Firestonebacteria bacterium]